MTSEELNKFRVGMKVRVEYNAFKTYKRVGVVIETNRTFLDVLVEFTNPTKTQSFYLAKSLKILNSLKNICFDI